MSCEILVIGAGVVGLSCALKLSELGYKVTVAADQFSSDTYSTNYTSVWAGAHYRPMPIASYPGGEKEAYLTSLTYAHFRKLAETAPESSVTWTTGYEVVERPNHELTDSHYRSTPGFEQIDPQSIVKSAPPSAFAAQYPTWVVNPPVYLAYLEKKLKDSGAKLVKLSKLPSLKAAFELFPSTKLIVNASGMGIQYEGGTDPASFPIRGQTFLLKISESNRWQKGTLTYQLANGDWCFNIPRPMSGNCMILGGTKQIGSTSSSVSAEDCDKTLANAQKIYPEILAEDYKVERINVGLRPARKGGSRVELESIPGNKHIVHAYGFGGYGYEASWGAAIVVSELVESIPAKSNL